MSLLWESEDMVDAMGGRPFGNLPEGITGISIDTRTLEKGDAFFAIKGENSDGHDYATAAMAAGAALLVVAEAKIPALGRLQVPMIVVDDVLRALEKLGAAARIRSKAKIIAVTGSAGKTTTKAMLRLALEPSGSVHASAKSYNNHWGVPLTLARMPADTRYGVFEIGMNHPNEIRPLVKMVRPHIAIITTIAAAHMGNFENLDGIADAKAEIFEGIVRNGFAILNRDNEKFDRLAKAAKVSKVGKVYSFGEKAKSQFKLTNCVHRPDGSSFIAKIDGEKVAVNIGSPGRHIVQNALAVLGAVKLAGADLAKAAHALAKFNTGKGRGETHRLKLPRGSITLIDESYNANPASMEAAIGVLASSGTGSRSRKIAVLGDMLELGKFSSDMHAGLAAALRLHGINLVYCAGSEMKALAEQASDDLIIHHEDSVDELIPVLMNAVRSGDALMIKSSNGTGFSKIVDAFVKKYPAVPNVRY